MERHKGEYIYVVKGRHFDMCKFFKKPQLDPFYGIAFATNNKYGNLLKTCPIQKVFR